LRGEEDEDEVRRRRSQFLAVVIVIGRCLPYIFEKKPDQ
jgi:hypothetical protein